MPARKNYPKVNIHPNEAEDTVKKKPIFSVE